MKVCDNEIRIILIFLNGEKTKAMKMTKDEILKVLAIQKIRVSKHRLAVLSYLAESKDHPTADRIFRDLKATVKKLSKATVYNTLNALATAGVIRQLTIEGSEARYDIEIHPHGHFVCESCGAITNFRVEIDAFSFSDLNQFRIREKDVFFRGLCPKCTPSSEEKQ
jgi:Fur family transcriptional regulator, peroxide stress response regulator